MPLSVPAGSVPSGGTGGSSGVKDLAGNPLAAAFTSTFRTAAAPAPTSTPLSLWPSNPTPAQPSDPDTASVEIGVKFTSDIAGKIYGIRFYKGPNNTGIHTGSLWDNNGNLLATADLLNRAIARGTVRRFVFTSSMAVYGVVLAGWASGSTYPLLGGLRSTAQVVSYEIAMGLSLVAVFLYAGSMSTSEIVAAQEDTWFAFILIPSFLIYMVAMVGETNRAPFDLPEAEGELVGGFHTEYSSLKFALFFLAEYVNMVTVSALATTLFLGGWRAPWPLSIWDGANQGWWPVLWFTVKVFLFLFVFIWLRGTLPRLRYDQFMQLGWKILVPFSLGWLMIVAVARTVVRENAASDGSPDLLRPMAAVKRFMDLETSPRLLDPTLIEHDGRFFFCGVVKLVDQFVNLGDEFDENFQYVAQFELTAKFDGTLVSGSEELLTREVSGLVVAAMTLPNVLTRLFEGAAVVTPGDRGETVLGVLAVHSEVVWEPLGGGEPASIETGEQLQMVAGGEPEIAGQCQHRTRDGADHVDRELPVLAAAPFPARARIGLERLGGDLLVVVCGARASAVGEEIEVDRSTGFERVPRYRRSDRGGVVHHVSSACTRLAYLPCRAAQARILPEQQNHR